MLEELPGDPRHEACGSEDRNDGEADGDDGKPDLVGGLDRRLVGGFPHPNVAHDVLDLDDGVIDEDARRERNRKQTHKVE